MPEARRRFAAQTPGLEEVPPWDLVWYLNIGLFGGVRMAPMLEDLDRILPDWRPDLLIHGSTEMAGAIAAEGLAIRHIEHSLGLRPAELKRRGARRSRRSRSVAAGQPWRRSLTVSSI